MLPDTTAINDGYNRKGYQLTSTDNSANESRGDLDIKSSVTLKGAGAGQTILEGDGNDRVLEIYQANRVSVEGVTIRNGRAGSRYGGGIYKNGNLTLKDSTVSGNTANSGGGIHVYGSSATANLSFFTLTLNGATGTNSAGGGIYIASGTVQLKGVILAGNTGGSGPECSGSLTSQGYDLIKSDANCGFTAQTTDITGQNPALGALANNGGPAQTHLPQAGSPVLDKVPSADCTALLTTDQRGVSRPQGPACDIGAVERQP